MLLPRVLIFIVILAIVEFYYMTNFHMTTCFFFRRCPPEELPHQKWSPRRGESDSSTPEASGGLLVTVFEAFRQTLETAA